MPDSRSKANAEGFDLAAEGYDSPVFSFFNDYGEALVDAAGVSNNQHVLEICCGTGAVSIPAAKRVGPGGRVLGVDISDGMLTLARDKAVAAGTGWLEFTSADAQDIDLGEKFDVGLCSFGLLFFDDMTAPLRKIAAHLSPKGLFAASLWQKEAFKPHVTLFHEGFKKIRPDLTETNRLDPGAPIDKAASAMSEAGFQDVTIIDIDQPHRLENFGEWWHFLMYAGMRSQIMKLTQDELDRFRDSHSRDMEPLANPDGSHDLRIPAQIFVGHV